MLAASPIGLLCLTDLGFFDPTAIAQDMVGRDRGRTVMKATVLAVEQEKTQRRSRARSSRNVRTVAR